jgi:membrane protease YdiL (CAAX protease family)
MWRLMRWRVAAVAWPSRYMNETFPLSPRYENLLSMATDVAVREDEGGAPAYVLIQPAVTSTPRWLAAVGRSLLPLALVALISLAGLVGSDASSWPGRSVLAGLVVVTLACAVTGRAGSAQLGLGLTATVAASALLPWQVGWWPLPGLIGVGVYILFHLVGRGRAAGHRAMLRFGRVAAAEAWMVVGLVVLSASVLLVFSRLAPPHLGTGARFLVALTPESLVVVGVAFAAVNAFVEEVLFRGAVLHHLGHVLGSWPAVLVQALAFGMLHLNGYPYGLAGVVLASVYGLLLGALRLRSGGLLAPWIAHVCADAVIFVLIVHAAT